MSVVLHDPTGTWDDQKTFNDACNRRVNGVRTAFGNQRKYHRSYDVDGPLSRVILLMTGMKNTDWLAQAEKNMRVMHGVECVVTNDENRISTLNVSTSP